MRLTVVLCTLISLGPAVAETHFYESREEIPEAYRWDLGDIFESLEAWEAAAAQLEGRLEELEQFEGRLGESAGVLAAALDLRTDLGLVVEDLYVYASQWNNLDTRGAEANRYLARARGLLARFGEATAYFEPEISRLGDEWMEKALEDPRLGTFRHRLADIRRQRDHILSPEIEAVLASSSLLTQAPTQIYTSLVSADIAWPSIEGDDGEPAVVVPGQYIGFLRSADRRVREEALKALFSTYWNHGNTIAATYSASVHKDLWLARTRGYGSTLEMVLGTTNVEPQVLDTLVGAVRDNLDAVHDYVDLRRRALDLEAIHPYDMYVGLVPEAHTEYTFDEGWGLAMAFWRETFGEEYAAVAERALAERWIDVYTNAGKRGGAYSWGTYRSHPFLFLNWSGALDDVFTLVHEMGHSIHSYMANEHQPPHDADYTLFVAEVASVASESLFAEWLLDRTEDPATRQALVNHALDSLAGTFLRQVFFHEFEARAHALAQQGEALTRESLGEVWLDQWQQYYGDGVVLDDEIKAGWARIPHYYRTFYVWVYATSYAAGEAIAARFRNGDESAVDDYLAMLELGGSVYPMDAIRRAGVDLGDPSVIGAVMGRFRTLTAELDGMLGPPEGGVRAGGGEAEPASPAGP